MKITNNSNRDIKEISEMMESFYPFAKKRLDFDQEPTAVFESDPQNAENVLGKTAHYPPGS